jgi:hypothetical protein
MSENTESTEPESDQGSGEGPGTGDDRILEGLASGLNQRRTAEFAGVHPKTVQRRLADPAFAVLVAQRRAERVRELVGQLTATGDEAIAVIREAMSEEHPIRVRLDAARLGLSTLSSFQSRHELDARIADLEAVVALMAAQVADWESA